MAGRKPSVNANLPKGMRARKRGDNIYYYYDTGGKPRKEIPLGKDYVLAVQEWSRLEVNKVPPPSLPTIEHAINRYNTEIMPTKAYNTRRGHNQCLKNIINFFCNPPAKFDDINPIHIAQYLSWRKSSPSQANLEMRVFSHIWNCAREWGYTDKANPTSGIKKNKEKGRKDAYIEDYIFQMVYDCADDELKDVMDIAYLTGQRPIDVLALDISNIHNGAIKIVQIKTKAVVRIAIKGRLKDIIDRRISQYGHLYFFNEKGSRLTSAILSVHFARIRKLAAIKNPQHSKSILSFQFRDIRAKAGTDVALKTGNDTSAQKQLGHASLSMTKRYIRKDPIVDPTE